MKVLTVYAHPNQDSFNNAGLDGEFKKATGHTVGCLITPNHHAVEGSLNLSVNNDLMSPFN